MSESIAGIPTLYNGILFRSRNEAKWAAFFDRIRWEWSYEPVDLLGYIPDFIVTWPCGRSLLVEIKAHESLVELRGAESKIEDSGWVGEALVVGGSLLGIDDASPIIGRLGEPVFDVPGETHTWGEARLFTCLSCGAISVMSADYSWHCRSCLAAEHHMGSADGVRELWADACNRTQWQPRYNATRNAPVTCSVTGSVTATLEGSF